jgi:hypothetical protein
MSADEKVPSVRVLDRTAIVPVLRGLSLGVPRPVLVVVGGADAMDASVRRRFEQLLVTHVIPVVHERRAMVIDGGTDSGVMRAMGRARSITGERFPLVGVCPSGHSTRPEPHHSHVLVVPGDSFGDESEWIADIATSAAGSHPSVTLLANGGEVALRDVELSVQGNRPVVVLDASGRAADDICSALAARPATPRTTRIARSSLVSCVPLDDGDQVRQRIQQLL